MLDSRKCHSDFEFLAELEGKCGEDALLEYWYAMILSSISKDNEVDCLMDHLVKFYQKKLNEVTLKHKYIKNMLYMLHSLQKPFDVEAIR